MSTPQPWVNESAIAGTPAGCTLHTPAEESSSGEWSTATPRKARQRKQRAASKPAPATSTLGSTAGGSQSRAASQPASAPASTSKGAAGKGKGQSTAKGQKPKGHGKNTSVAAGDGRLPPADQLQAGVQQYLLANIGDIVRHVSKEACRGAGPPTSHQSSSQGPPTPSRKAASKGGVKGQAGGGTPPPTSDKQEADQPAPAANPYANRKAEWICPAPCDTPNFMELSRCRICARAKLTDAAVRPAGSPPYKARHRAGAPAPAKEPDERTQQLRAAVKAMQEAGLDSTQAQATLDAHLSEVTQATPVDERISAARTTATRCGANVQRLKAALEENEKQREALLAEYDELRSELDEAEEALLAAQQDMSGLLQAKLNSEAAAAVRAAQAAPATDSDKLAAVRAILAGQSLPPAVRNQLAAVLPPLAPAETRQLQ